MAKRNKWIVFVSVLLITIFSISCKKESKAMNTSNFWNSVDKLTTMKFSNREEAEKVLGVELKTAEGNESVSFYEYNGELPGFPNSTYADVRISNDKSGWYLSLALQLSTCITSEEVMKKYPQGEFIPSNPNNLSPDAVHHYKKRMDSGILIFGFNVNSGCLTKMAFDRNE
jgi:hypothetical protein